MDSNRSSNTNSNSNGSSIVKIIVVTVATKNINAVKAVGETIAMGTV